MSTSIRVRITGRGIAWSRIGITPPSCRRGIPNSRKIALAGPFLRQRSGSEMPLPDSDPNRIALVVFDLFLTIAAVALLVTFNVTPWQPSTWPRPCSVSCGNVGPTVALRWEYLSEGLRSCIRCAAARRPHSDCPLRLPLSGLSSSLRAKSLPTRMVGACLAVRAIRAGPPMTSSSSNPITHLWPPRSMEPFSLPESSSSSPWASQCPSCF